MAALARVTLLQDLDSTEIDDGLKLCLSVIMEKDASPTLIDMAMTSWGIYAAMADLEEEEVYE